MKKILSLFLLCYQFASAQSPITFNISDVPTAGQFQRIAMDTVPLPSVNFGSKGANQVYDFNNLTVYKYDTVEFRTPTSGQLSTCPNADVATTTDGTNFLLTNTDNANNKLTLEGFQGSLCAGQTITAAYSTKPDVHHFPTTYQSNFSGTGYLQKTVSAAQVCQSFPVTQVRLTTSSTYTDTVDGWGKVITPVGAYKCLRKQHKETTTTTIEANILGSWNTVSNTTKTTVRYTYVTKEAKGSVINFNYDTADVLQSITWSMTPPAAPTADFSFATGANGLVNFTDLSDGYPTSWAWTFGDGGTSTSQNPSHTYTANGTYTVCLIATNAGGSSTQVCKQVTVSNVAAVTPVANFSWTNPSGGLVNFTDLSTNTPTQWAWTFGDGGTSTLQNPNHIYAANNTYNVCLTATNTAGGNQVCKNVVVTGIAAGNNAPVAVTDYVTITGGSSQIIHVATNDIDPDNDNLCITDVWGSPYATEYIGGSCDMILYAPDSSFSGPDTCYYKVCDDGTPVLCDTGMVVFNVNELNLPPVAVDDSFSVLQATGIVYVPTGNDTDPNNDNLCVTSVWGSNSVMVNPGSPCNDVYFISDTCYTGLLSFYYSACDPDGLCDTGLIKVNVLPNAAYVTDAYYNVNAVYYQCQTLTVYNGSQNYNSNVWTVHEFFSAQTDTFTSDTLYYIDFTAGMFNGEICLTTTNQCGSDYFCDTLQTACENVKDVTLTNISLYPNPTGNVLTIDMRENNEEITLHYSSIDIYNALGEKVKALPRKTESKMVSLSVADLANGLYVVTITGAKGERKTLGRFTVNR